MSGYIGTQPVPQATQTRQTFVATAAQTSFATGGYQAGYLDVFLNGVKLAAADYTATNGSDIVLTVGAALDDTLEVVAYTAFEVLDQSFTGTTTTDVLTTTGAFTSLGIDDNATSTAVTLDASGNVLVGQTGIADYTTTVGTSLRASGFSTHTSAGAPLLLNRLTTDGDIVLLRKDNTTAGSIGVENSNRLFIDSGTGNTGIRFDAAAWVPRDAGVVADGAVDLGSGGARLKDAYLSGGVYLGGTGAANKLDDYEEGTWTPILKGTGTAGTWTSSGGTPVGSYVKIGRVYFITFELSGSLSGATSDVQISGLPVSSSGNDAGFTVTFWNGFTTGQFWLGGHLTSSGTAFWLKGNTAASTEMGQVSVSELGTGAVVIRGTAVIDAF